MDVVMKEWGLYEVLRDYSNVKVKILIIKPNQETSYQKHLYRSESLVIVQGMAEIWCEHKPVILRKNQLIFIEKDCNYQIINVLNDEDLIICETQIGDKCLEEDVVLYEKS